MVPAADSAVTTSGFWIKQRMDFVAKTLAPVRRAAHQFFNCDLQLSLRGGLQISLVERQGTEPPLSAAELARRRQRDEVKLMVVQLGKVLDDEPDARQTLRHLAFIEQAVLAEGLHALRTVPLEVLQRGLSQFEDLVTNWAPEGLANLRSRMAVALHQREVAQANSVLMSDQRQSLP